MPCTLEQWEVDYEEKRENKQKYGVDITDEQLNVRLLCEILKLIRKHVPRDWQEQLFEHASPELVAWEKAHKARDKKKRKARRAKR